jgi:hypothetical protein
MFVWIMLSWTNADSSQYKRDSSSTSITSLRTMEVYTIKLHYSFLLSPYCSNTVLCHRRRISSSFSQTSLQRWR